MPPFWTTYAAKQHSITGFGFVEHLGSYWYTMLINAASSSKIECGFEMQLWSEAFYRLKNFDSFRYDLWTDMVSW